MLAVTYGLEKFHHYTFGRQVFVVTDHKPLVAISNKSLSKAPKRLQTLLLRAQKYTFDLSWSPVTEIPVADALSRAPVHKPCEEELIHCVTENGLRDERMQQIRDATATYQSLTILGAIILKGWPNHKDGIPMEALPYFNYRDELTIQDGIIYRGERIVVPKALRQDMKNRVHAGHLCITSCLRRARDLITRNWGFTHETISPGNSQANGAAEAAVKIAKRILRKSQSSGENHYVALLNLRNTPTEGLHTSSALRLFGRRTKSMMPTAEAQLKPGYVDPSREAELKVNRRALTAPSGRRDLMILQVDDTFRMQAIRTGEREWKQARVKRAITTRAFEVEADGRSYRRNRRHLRISAKSTHSLPAKQYRAIAARRCGANEPAPPIELPDVPTLEGAALQSEEIDRDTTGEASIDRDTTGEASLTTRCGRHVRKRKRFEV